MTDVAHSIDKLFALNPQRRTLLLGAISAGRMSFPNTEIQLRAGVSQAKIDGFRRDLVDYSSEGVIKLKERHANAKTEKSAKALQKKIDAAPAKYEAATIGLAAALAQQRRRELALSQWLRACGLKLAETRALAHCLRHNVTYIHYLASCQTLYVETD